MKTIRQSRMINQKKVFKDAFIGARIATPLRKKMLAYSRKHGMSYSLVIAKSLELFLKSG